MFTLGGGFLVGRVGFLQFLAMHGCDAAKAKIPRACVLPLSSKGDSL